MPAMIPKLAPPTDAEIEATLQPFIGREAMPGDADWQSRHDAMAGKIGRRRIRRRWLGWLPQATRDKQAVKVNYEKTWAGETAVEALRSPDRDTMCLWGDRRLLIDANGTKRVHMLAIMRVLEALAPASLLEVGCGNGRNMVLLAARFPELAVAGVELTRAGVEAVHAVRREPTLPGAFAEFSPEPPQSATAHRRIAVAQGSADALPVADASVDVVLTALALEQMEAIRPAALDEIARVTKRWVMMVEPFRDWNEEGLRRDYITSHQYFQARIADLAGHGLRPVFVCDRLPSKVQMAAGLVLAEKA
jgi:SAM-dependent methyltransferase